MKRIGSCAIFFVLCLVIMGCSVQTETRTPARAKPQPRLTPKASGRPTGRGTVAKPGTSAPKTSIVPPLTASRKKPETTEMTAEPTFLRRSVSSEKKPIIDLVPLEDGEHFLAGDGSSVSRLSRQTLEITNVLSGEHYDLSPNGKKIFVRAPKNGGFSTATLYNDKGSSVKTFSAVESFNVYPKSRSAVFSPDGDNLAFQGPAGLEVYEAKYDASFNTGLDAPANSRSSQGKSYSYVYFSPEGNNLLVHNGYEPLELWNLYSRKRATVSNYPTPTLLTFLDGGNKVLVADGDSTDIPFQKSRLLFLSAQDGQRDVLDSSQDAITTAASHTGRSLVIRFLRNGGRTNLKVTNLITRHSEVYGLGTQNYTDAVFSPLGGFLAVLRDNKDFVIFKVADDAAISVYTIVSAEEKNLPYQPIVFEPSGRYVALTGIFTKHRTDIVIYDLIDKKFKSGFFHLEDSASSMRLNGAPTSGYFVGFEQFELGENRAAPLWIFDIAKAETKKIQLSFSNPRFGGFSPDKTKALVFSAGIVAIVDLVKGKEYWVSFRTGIGSVAFLNDKSFVVGLNDGAVVKLEVTKILANAYGYGAL